MRRRMVGIRAQTVAAAVFALVSAALFVGVVVLATLSIAGAPAESRRSASSTSTSPLAHTPLWMPLRSTAPQAVASVLLSSSFYAAAEGTPDFGPVLRACQPGEAVLVHSLRPSSVVPDLWVLPMRDASGHTRALLTAAYDEAGQRIGQPSLGLVNPGDFNYARPLPPLSLSAALAALTARGLAPAATSGSGAPMLVYFPPVRPSATAPLWTGGGSSNAPMWQITASDGATYCVGVDGRVYTLAQLPIDPAA